MFVKQSVSKPTLGDAITQLKLPSTNMQIVAVAASLDKSQRLSMIPLVEGMDFTSVHDTAVGGRRHGKTYQPGAVSGGPPPKSNRLSLSLVQKVVDRLKSHCTMDSSEHPISDWLVVTSNTDGPSVGCRFCKKWTPKRPKVSNIKRHGNSSAHLIELASQHPGSSPTQTPTSPVPVHKAPTVAQFESCLASRKKAEAFSSNQGGGAAEHQQRLTFCLAEAVLDRQRTSLRNASVIALHQDMRKSLLVTRFTACGDSGIHKGLLGIAGDFGSSAADIQLATLQILANMCTPRHCPPRRSRLGSSLDKALYEHVCSIVEVFDADNAADEQKAGRLLGGRSTVPPALKNLRCLLRDKTHATTRRCSDMIARCMAAQSFMFVICSAG